MVLISTLPRHAAPNKSVVKPGFNEASVVATPLAPQSSAALPAFHILRYIERTGHLSGLGRWLHSGPALAATFLVLANNQTTSKLGQ